ncbi:MAG TPA: glycosyltransferase family 1 protein [Terriglobales bacterium]|nr:glycosyltransferase family 1 protein [Terriglobales bacterium]
MKIAYDHRIFCGQRYGGISRYFCEIATRIGRTQDCEVKIYAPLHINVFAKDVPQVFGVFTAAIPRTQRLRQALNEEIVRRQLAQGPPDILHETYYGPRSVAPPSSQVVVTIHDMIPERLPQLMPNHDTTARSKAASVRRADHIICVSQNTRKDVIEILGVHPDKVSVVHLGSSLSACKPRSMMQSADGRPYILYVGVRAGYKNFDGLLKAYANSSALRRDFDLICFGGPRFTPEENREMKALGLQGHVLRMTGADELLCRVYSSATCLVYPSLYEGFGIPIAEAMACECPVVCSSTSSMTEVAGDAAQYFDPYDSDNMQVAIEKVVNSNDARGDLRSRGRRRATQFSWERCAKHTLEIYSSLSSRSPGHPAETVKCVLS